MIPILRFCYFLENILSLGSYYQLSYASIWLGRILHTIANTLIKSWNIHFNLTLNWSNAAGTIWKLKQSIKPCNLNESIVAITNTSCVYLLIRVWVFCFLEVQKFKLLPIVALDHTKATRSRIGLVKFPF